MSARASSLLLAAAFALAGCTIEVNDWQVACGMLAEATCRPVVELALGKLGWRSPASPQGTIRIDARECPVDDRWPAWADRSQCWQVVIPLDSADFTSCMVIARRLDSGEYGQVGGDAYSL